MKERLNIFESHRGALKHLYGLELYLSKCGLETSLLHLLKFRVSQINGCAFCLDMHSKDLRAVGDSEQRLYVLEAWRESPFYSERERAALAWAEAVTLVTEGHVPDEVYEQARRQFNEAELADLTLAVVAINGWNRLNIAIGAMSGAGSWGLAVVADVGSGAARVTQQPQCIGDFRDGRCPQFSTQHLAARICWSA